MLALAVVAGSAAAVRPPSSDRVGSAGKATAAADRSQGDQVEPVIEAGCDTDCVIGHISGEYIPSRPAVIASQVGSTYSVHHMLGADHDAGGREGTTCVRIFDSDSPTGDGVALEGGALTIRPDILGTVAAVGTTQVIEADGRRLLWIETSSPPGTDLFPAGQALQGRALTDACFAVGLDDPLDLGGADVVLAVARFTQDGRTVIGPQDVTGFFAQPWDGIVNLTVPGGAGLGINGVELEIQVQEAIGVPNDDCDDSIAVGNEATAFSTVGATTDGIEHPVSCLQNSYSDIYADVWFRYFATCTGTLTVDLCASDFDTKFAVYNCGRCPIEVEPLICNDDFCSLRSYGQVAVTQGSCYLIRVGGYQFAEGQGVLQLSCNQAVETGACCVGASCVGNLAEPNCLQQGGQWFMDQECPGFVCPEAIPPNDDCGDAIRIFTGVPYLGSTVNATGTDITDCTPNDSKDVWHFWTADCTGWATFETCNAPPEYTLDTSLAVFDACGGELVACNDDGCQGIRSRIGTNNDPFPVVQGQTYYLRVSARNHETGAYRINVIACQNACCAPNGQCHMITAATCEAGGGDPQIPGTVCLGDQDENGTDDTCEACPVEPRIVNALPVSGTLDSRQPFSPMSPLPRQGIGSPGEIGSQREAILVAVIPRFTGLENCFEVCETVPDPLLGENQIVSVTEVGEGDGFYEIVLHHAITAGGVTTIEYTGNPTSVPQQYTAHPGNVRATAASPGADPTDITGLISCCLEGASCNPPVSAYSCDLDRSGLASPLDILTAVGLLLGSEEWTQWNNTARPQNTTCPPP
jgi:hypothetical protein